MGVGNWHPGSWNPLFSTGTNTANCPFHPTDNPLVLTNMFAEFRFAARTLLRWRSGAIAATLTLALGIGATTALYALVRVILADLPGVPDIGRLARIYASSPSLGVERSPVALNEFDASLSKATSFSAIGAYAAEDATIGTVPDDRVVTAGYASPAFFRAMDVKPVYGRLFTAADIDGSAPVVMVGEAFWRKQFPDGRMANASVRVDGIDRTVVGVMPSEFAYGFVGIGADVWIPLGHASTRVPSIVSVFARLRPDATWQTAAAELTSLSKKPGPWIWRAIPITDDTNRRAMSAYAFTLGPALLILLIACVNVACLLMARGIARDQELSVRRALGATRARIVRLLLLENAALGIASGAIGAALAFGLLRTLASALATLPGMGGRTLVDGSLLPIAVASSAVACLLFGTVPAIRLSTRDVAASLNGVPARHRVHIAGYGARDLIVFAEIATSVGLIVWTAMAFTLLREVRGMRLTLPADRIVGMRVPGSALPTIVPRLAAIPGVIRVSSSATGLGGGLPVLARTDDGRSVRLSTMPVGEGFFEAVGLPILRGRAFDRTEVVGATGVAVLSETAARQLAPDANVVGQRLRITDHATSTVVVIGVTADAVDYGGVARAGLVPGDIYLPLKPSAMDATIVARTAGDPHALLKAMADVARTPLAARPPRPVIVSEDWQHNGRGGTNYAGATFIFRILGGFALLSLLLAGSGVFAVISQSVAQRTREFGIRMAIGATPRAVLRMVLARESKLIVSAMLSGTLFAAGLTRMLFVQLTTLSAQMPALWTGALLFSSLVAATAVALATFRIVRLEPSAVLRRL